MTDSNTVGTFEQLSMATVLENTSNVRQSLRSARTSPSIRIIPVVKQNMSRIVRIAHQDLAEFASVASREGCDFPVRILSLDAQIGAS